MKLFYRGIILCALFLLSSCAQDIVDVTGGISGVVKDYTTGQVIENCQVSLSPSGTTVVTNAEGRYTFKSLQVGTYTMTFTKIGYNDQSTTVDVVSGQTTTRDVQLEKTQPIEFSTQILDFGDYNSTMSFSVKNNTSSKYEISLVSKVEWLTFSQTRATVAANNQLNITAYVDRSLVGYGTYNTTVTIDYVGGTEGNIVMQVKMMKTKESAPTVETRDAFDITASSFKIGGVISATGGSVVTSYGHCWSTNPNPTINDQHTDYGRTTETMSFTSSINQNLVNTIVYVRAYATNQYGTSYGNEVQVTSTSVDPGDDGDFAGGTGTAIDPYRLRTSKHMQNMKNNPSAHFKMIADIDMDGINWIPFELEGGFDGDNHVLYNLKINPYVTSDYQGLFSKITSSGSVKNLTIDGVEINAPSYSYIGAIAGYSECSISNCHVILKQSNAITGNNNVGGIVGSTKHDVINCTVSSNMTGSVIVGNKEIGGAVGDISYYKISNVNVSCNISCCNGTSSSGEIYAYTGGIVGYSISGIISQCTYSGTMTSLVNKSRYIGGIAGCANQDSNESGIFACKTNVVFDCKDDCAGIGGIVGRAYNNLPVRACYSQGSVLGTDTQPVGSYYLGVSGLADIEGAEIQHCFTLMDLYVTQTSASLSGSFSIKDLANQFPSPINITEIMRAANSEYASYWNYNNTWTWTGTVNGKTVTAICPKLAWE